MSKFILLLGPSGVGKSTIIDALSALDDRFVYISPYITRSLRAGESSKVSVSDQQMDEMRDRGKLLVINELYDIRYATPKLPIVQALSTDHFPVLDWPVTRLEIMTDAFPGQLYIVYIAPPSLKVLRQRLAKDGRDANGQRFESAESELQAYWSGQYSGMCDLEITATENCVQQLAEAIYADYLKSF